jgi:hypothetical protein
MNINSNNDNIDDNNDNNCDSNNNNSSSNNSSSNIIILLLIISNNNKNVIMIIIIIIQKNYNNISTHHKHTPTVNLLYPKNSNSYQIADRHLSCMSGRWPRCAKIANELSSMNDCAAALVPSSGAITEWIYMKEQL